MIQEGQARIPSGCAISGIFSKSGERFSGADIIQSITVMHDRSNGLGGGFAAYGVYPEYKDYYAFHLFYDNQQAQKECEDFLHRHFDIANCSEIPTKRTEGVTDAPLIWRYFGAPHTTRLSASQLDEREYVAKCVFRINGSYPGAYVFSSGKNMGVFKGVGFPEDIARFYMLDTYEGHCFTAHGRYPTNTPGWWGGAHPFALLDYSVVHNGEISSYDANRRAIEMYGYKCDLLTDTEVIAYIIDYLHRKKGLTFWEIAQVIAAPFWQTIETMPEEERQTHEYLRSMFSSQLITGPFSIIAGFEGGMMALNDRLKLRSMVVGEKGDRVYISSEEAAIRVIEPDLDRIWSPKGGELVLVNLEGGTA
ncbi:MAG: glutamine amidotransferase family protein [Clostridiales bacterium]|jgi:glutamate synthase domain-containing protein 1|nr:glutamine amidotransferase family protein [Clostridiales bacterium]